MTEAIVNAVAHRDYTDSSSVQVMLFQDRLDVMNSGRLPPPLTVEKLRGAHESLPGNPLLAQSMYLRGYIERMGTGTVDMIRRCAKAGLPEPEFVARGNFVTTIRRAGFVAQRETELGVAEAATPEATQETGQTTQEIDRTTQEKDETTQEISPTTQETTQETGQTTQEKDETTQEKIVALLREEPEITMRLIAERIGITQDGVKYHIRKLRASGTIRHVGATEAGSWEVLK